MLRHQGPSITPSLANYVRTDLIAHVMNWPADILEKQVIFTLVRCIFYFTSVSRSYVTIIVNAIAYKLLITTIYCISVLQAQKSSDDAHIIGNLQCTKVSADLKSARSVVRITEITATLQEQK